MSNLNYRIKFLFGRIRRMFFMALPENEDDLRKSRNYFIAGDTAAQTIVQLAGGTFIVSLMTNVGISDANIGILTSLSSLAAIFQLLTMQMVRKLKKRKLFVCFSILQKLLFALIYFVPLMYCTIEIKALLVILGYFYSYIWTQVSAPSTQDWLATLVPGNERGRYFAIKDSVAVFVTVTAMLLCGIVLDYFKVNEIKTGFIIIGIVLIILVLINLISFCLMKEPRLSLLNKDGKEMHGKLAKRAEASMHEPVESMFKEIHTAFSQKLFRKAFILNCLWQTSFYISSPFNSSFQIKELELPYTFIMVVGFIVNLVRIYITPKVGRLADRHGMARMFRLTLLGILFSYLFMAVSTPSIAYITMPLSSTCSSIGWSFVGIGLFGIQLEFVDKNKRMIQLALMSSISGLYGFVISLIGGQLLDYIQSAELTLFGAPIYAQQILNILGVVLVFITFLYTRYSIEPIKIERDTEDGTVL